jgi:hypothetical protein
MPTSWQVRPEENIYKFFISAHSPRNSSGGGGQRQFIETELFLAGLKFDLKGHYRLRVTCTVLTDEENKTQQF